MIAKGDNVVGEPAGRVFRFSERTETNLAGAMKDIDEMGVAVKRLYPGNTWTRSEMLLLFFLDDCSDSLRVLVNRGEDA